MIVRLILILLVLWAVYGLVRQVRGAAQRRDGQPANKAKTGEMVRCDHCGTHVPAENAIISDSGTYCCEEHHRQHR